MLLKLVLNTSLTKASFDAIAPLNVSGYQTAKGLANYLEAAASGVGYGSCALTISEDAIQATATLTNTGAATAVQVVVIANVTLTAVASSPTPGVSFVVSGTPAVQAANIAACINAAPGLAGIVTATSNLGIVTVTAVNPGKSGNGLQFSETLANVTSTAFASGSDGTSYSYQLG